MVHVDASLVTTANTAGLLPVHIVAKRGHNELMKLLIKYGADIDIADDEGRTPLILACQVRVYCCHGDVIVFIGW